jgi:hypothetical protein
VALRRGAVLCRCTLCGHTAIEVHVCLRRRMLGTLQHRCVSGVCCLLLRCSLCGCWKKAELAGATGHEALAVLGPCFGVLSKCSGRILGFTETEQLLCMHALHAAPWHHATAAHANTGRSIHASWCLLRLSLQQLLAAESSMALGAASSPWVQLPLTCILILLCGGCGGTVAYKLISTPAGGCRSALVCQSCHIMLSWPMLFTRH